MTAVVGIHGAFHEMWGPNQLHSRWLPAMQDGLWHHGARMDPADLSMVFYGDIFRHDPDIGAPDDTELIGVAKQTGLLDMVDEQYGPHGLEVLADMIGRETLRVLLDQLARYFADAAIRSEVQRRLEALIASDTRVLIGHSMGTIVAYEALAANPDWPVTTLITLGSPLSGDYVFTHLMPEPEGDRAVWPGSIAKWVNVTALNDTVIRGRVLEPRFSGVTDARVINGQDGHRAEHYLNAPVTGLALKQGLEETR
jgi:pimeloyl-ACP methyl ester carboxylesterase